MPQHSTARALAGCPTARDAARAGFDLAARPGDLDRALSLELAARRVLSALAQCPPADRLALVEFCLDAMRAGAPIPAFGRVMAEARHWSEFASRAELKAYAAACFSRLGAADQAAFLRFAEERGAA